MLKLAPLHVRAPLLLTLVLASCLGSGDLMAEFEKPGTVASDAFLSQALAAGPNHTVSSEAEADGFQITYRVNSRFGTFTAIGIPGLEKVVAEINALTYLEAMTQEPAFLQAQAKVNVATASAVFKAFTAPVIAVQAPDNGVPRLFAGNKRGFRLDRRLVRGGGANQLTTEHFTAMNEKLSARERSLAQQVNTDPYSANVKLRQVISSISLIATHAEAVSVQPERVADLISNPVLEAPVYLQDPTELERRSEQCLQDLGVRLDELEQFMAAAYLTPTTRAQTCSSLQGLKSLPGSTDIVTALALSRSFAATDFLLQIANFIIWYQSDVTNPKLTAITVSDGFPYGLIGNEAVLMLPAENLMWTKLLASRLKALDANKGRIWISGTPTEIASEQIRSRGWQLMTPPGQ